MTNLFDYIKWRGDLSADADGFSETDGLVLSALSYLPFELVPGQFELGSKTKDICSALLNYPGIQKKLHLKDDFKLMKHLVASARFGNMELLEYENTYDEKTQTQFSAITVKFSNDLHCVVFRGTDNTLVGWKEDFNMTFVCPVPAQELAVKYLERVSSLIDGDLLLCGHSKGGNLAIYAAAFCDPALISRIRKVYNYDGPGFDSKIMANYSYKRICSKINTFVPQSSVVGLLLDHQEDYTIIRSSQKGILQHDLYSWETLGRGFIYLDSVTKGSRFIDLTLKSWLESMDYRQREKFVDAMFSIVSNTNNRTLREISDNWLVSTKIMAKTVQNMDEETRTAVLKVLKSLMICAKNNSRLKPVKEDLAPIPSSEQAKPLPEKL